MKNQNWWLECKATSLAMDVLTNQVGQEIIFFDTETTGLSALTDRVIQLSAIKVKIEEDCTLKEIDRMDMYINPKRSLPKKITEITGITDDQLRYQPDETAAFQEIYNFFGEPRYICGHNSSFDVGMMSQMYKRANKVFAPVALDTLRMSQELHRKDEVTNHKLGTLAKYFGLDDGLSFHNAMDDIIATLRLFNMLIDEYREFLNKPKAEVHKKVAAKVKACWAYTGFRGMQRLYVRLNYENRLLWINQRRPYEWGEKDAGTIELVDMPDIERQVLELYHCKDLEELSQVRTSQYA